MYKRKQQPIAVKASKRQSGKKKDLWWKETFTTHFESMQITSDFVCVDIRTFGSYFAIYNVGILFNFTLLKTFSPSETFVRGSMCLVFNFFLWLPLLFLPGVLQVLFCSPIRSLVVTVSHLTSLRRKCFQAVSEQRNRAKNGASRRAGRGFARPKPKIPCVPRSFFVTKPHGKACYAGYIWLTVSLRYFVLTITLAVRSLSKIITTKLLHVGSLEGKKFHIES